MTGRKLLFLVPYAHLDTQWRWEYPTTIGVYLKATLEENFRLFARYPEHRFNFTGALRYAMIREYYPAHFELVKRLVRERRWLIPGSCLDETDALVPSVESMIRNILYGRRWVLEEFGADERDYLLPDCFGFPGNMPTVLAHCGIRGFSTQKLAWGSAVGIPFDIGLWRGPDGSEIISALDPGDYTSRLRFPPHEDRHRLGKLERSASKIGLRKSLQYYGTGDIGGAPDEASVRRAVASLCHCAKKGDLELKQGSPDEFFRGLEAGERQSLESYEGDFLLTNHSAGSISSAAIMKRWNRRNEQLAFAAEAAALSAKLFAGAPYPSDKIDTAWKRVIGCQMHDILPGTSTPTAYDYAYHDEILALSTWTTILRDSAEAVAPLVAGDGDFLLFNPSPEARRDVVEIDLPDWEGEVGLAAELHAAGGGIEPVQIRRQADGSCSAIFIPTLAPLEWSRHSLRPIPASSAPPSTLEDSVRLLRDEEGLVLENRRLGVRIAPDGAVVSIIRGEGRRELLRRPLAYELQRERPLWFPAWNMDWRDRKRKPRSRIEGGERLEILEEGPLRVSLRITFRFGSSTILRELSLSAHAEALDFVERIEWRERGLSLKLAIDSALEDPRLTSNWESSRASREVNGPKAFEFPSRHWVDLDDGRDGMAIVEDSKYGYDRPSPSMLRMTLLFTPGLWYVNGFWDQGSQDWGSHVVRWSLFAHDAGIEGVDARARRHNQPVQVFLLSATQSSMSGGIAAGRPHLSAGSSLLRISNPGIGILAVKLAEDGSGVLVRLYERFGRKEEGLIETSLPIHGAREVNGMEESLTDLRPRDGGLPVVLGPNSLKSLILEFSGEAENDELPQKAIALEFDFRLTSRNGEEGGGPLPSELFPPRLDAGRVRFLLARPEKPNALRCKGRRLDLPEGHSRLSILVAALEDRDLAFTLLGPGDTALRREERSVPALGGFLGSWDRRTWLFKPRHGDRLRRDYLWFNLCTGLVRGFVRRERLEGCLGHTHDRGRDLPRSEACLFTLEFDLPSAARALILPEDPAVFVLAATCSAPEVGARSVRRLLDTFDF